MSQRYSEDVEAGTEIAKQAVSSIWSLGSILALAGATIGIIKGKINLVRPLNGLINMTFKNESTLRQAINKLAESLSKQGKKGRIDFQKNLISGDLKNYLSRVENNEVKQAVDLVKDEFKQITQNSMIGVSTEKTNLKEILNKLFKSHFKEGKIAKWARNMTVEGSQLWISNKAGASLTEEVKKELGMNFNYKNYKTICNTLMVGGIPILGTIFAVPYVFNAWLTDIQKKAGKIGVMKAIENIDDPRYYANIEPEIV